MISDLVLVGGKYERQLIVAISYFGIIILFTSSINLKKKHCVLALQ
jgi:hypothetical protein